MAGTPEVDSEPGVTGGSGVLRMCSVWIPGLGGGVMVALFILKRYAVAPLLAVLVTVGAGMFGGAPGLGMMSGAAWAGEPTAQLSFLVLKDYNGKPVRNAAVVLHPVNTHGKQGRGGFELKTDSEGKTNFDGVPYGKLRVQVLAPGFQTYGEDYDVQSPKMEITVKLQLPQKQYSIYDGHAEEKKAEAEKDKGNDKKDSRDGAK